MNELDVIGLHLHKEPRGLTAERFFAAGGSGSGKSTVLDVCANKYMIDYARYGVRELLLDTKPRYAAEFDLTGVGAAWRYRKLSHAVLIPGSVRADLQASDFGLKDAWKFGYSRVIAQTDNEQEFPLLALAAEEFYKQARANRPQLLRVDEMADFFYGNGRPIGNIHAITRSQRAGREKALAVMGGSQRARGIPIQMFSDLTKLALFRLDWTDDFDHLSKIRLPEDVQPPTEDRIFYLWNKPRRIGGYYTLNLG